MSTVLWINAEGQQWWVRQPRQGWSCASAPAPGAVVHVLTDLPDEAFAELAVPRLFGKDRSDYLQRQLALRFPDTRYRALLPSAPQGGWIQRLAPPSQAVAAIESGERIDAALQGLDLAVAGVWSVSQVLAHLGRRKGLPPDLFVVLQEDEQLRIVFLKRRVAVLTRLVKTGHSPAACANELMRTLRHLENTHVVARDGQRFGVLLLGPEQDLAQTMDQQRFFVAQALPADHTRLLLDAVVQRPAGQLAPLQVRVQYLAIQVRRAAVGSACAVLAAALWLGAGMAAGIWEQRQAQHQSQALLAQVQASSEHLAQQIAAYGVSPAAVRKALAIDSAEVDTAPDPQTHLAQLAQAMQGMGGARIRELEWRMRLAQEPVCTAEGASAATASPPSGEATAEAPARAVELRFSLTPVWTTPWERERGMRAMNAALGALPGIQVVQDPLERLRSGSISMGQPSAETQDLVWCVRWPVAPKSAEAGA
ncbi:MAG: hypothetical protein ACT4NV_18930 [Rhodoferax sp.]